MRAVIRCPNSKRDYEIKIPATAGTLQRLWRKTIVSLCPHCGQAHLDGFRQLYAGAIMDLRRI